MHIQHIIVNIEGGGSARALFNLILNEQDNEHSIICLKSNGKSFMRIDNKCKSIKHFEFKNPFKDIFQILFFIKKTKPDIVQTWLYHSDLIGSLIFFVFGFRKVIWNVRCTLVNRNQFKFSTNLLIQICALLSYFTPKNIIFCSRRSLKDHLKIGYKKDISKVILNGVDQSIFYPDDKLRNSFRKEFNLNNKELVLGMVARYDVQKDHKNLLDALAILKKKGVYFKFFLVGPNIDFANKQLVNDIKNKSLEENIILCGVNHNLNYFYNGIDFHVLSSKSEGFPNVTLEAMACGTPCISTDNGDSSEIISKSGWICPVSNPIQLADCIEKASKENKINIQKRKEIAIDRIRNFYSIKKMVKEYVCLYSQIHNL